MTQNHNLKVILAIVCLLALVGTANAAYVLRERALTTVPTLDDAITQHYDDLVNSAGIGTFNETANATGEPPDIAGFGFHVLDIFSTSLGNIAIVLVIGALFLAIQISTKNTRHSVLAALLLSGLLVIMMPSNYLAIGAIALVCVIVGVIYSMVKHP